MGKGIWRTGEIFRCLEPADRYKRLGDGRKRGQPMKNDSEKNAVHFVAGILLLLLFIFALLGLYQGFQIIVDILSYIFR